MKSPSKLTSIKRFPTDEIYNIVAIDKDFLSSDEVLAQITKICSEELIYNILFKERLAGKPYVLENALNFITWAQKGWEKQEWFVYLVMDNNKKIAGAVDIKSNNLESAEIGYWASSEISGIMTNAVTALCNIAKDGGYKSLYGLTVLDNQKSQNVLTRAGFSNIGQVRQKGKDYIKFEKKL